MIRSRKAQQKILEKTKVTYKVTNMLVGPDKSLVIPIEFELDIKPEEMKR